MIIINQQIFYQQFNILTMLFFCRFLWTLYSNESGTHILKIEFQNALQIESELPPYNGYKKTTTCWERTVLSLFGAGQDKVVFEDFRAWIIYNKESTVLSRW